MGTGPTSTDLASARRAFQWMRQNMLTESDGRFGMYERWRINLGKRTDWVRPDSNTEMIRALRMYELRTGSKEFRRIQENLLDWVLDVQVKKPGSEEDGASLFYMEHGVVAPEGLGYDHLWPNDVGRVLRNLCWFHQHEQREDVLDAASRLGGLLLRRLSANGAFPQAGFAYDGPCFRLWPAAALSSLFQITGEKKYSQAAKLIFDALKPMQQDSGRFLTSYEMADNKGCSEDWRPVSSETAIAMKCFCIGYDVFQDESYRHTATRAADWILQAQHPSGGIVNSRGPAEGASLQQDHLVDLVYTNGYALMGLANMTRWIDVAYGEPYRRLKQFLIRIQCQGESEHWDGAWRGSYDPDAGCWDGTCDMNNELDEGGQYSVYAGWCTAPNVIGILDGEPTPTN